MALHVMIHMKCQALFSHSAEGGVTPAGTKVTGATIRTWLLNKFISFLAVPGWKSDKN